MMRPNKVSVGLLGIVGSTMVVEVTQDTLKGFAHAFREKFQYDYPDFSAINVVTLMSWAASCAMIFGGVVPYIPQYLDIYSSSNTEGFSTYVCLALLLANILRILFWFGHPFELPLLAQSVIMIVAMVALLELCIRIKRGNELTAKRRKLIDCELSQFWNWTHFSDYLQCLTLFVLVGSALTFSFINYPIYLESMGFVSVFTEAMLGAPQFYRNYQNRSTTGMSVKMVTMWFCGDTFKTGYFILKDAPIQFSICGLLQVTIDMAILYQVFHYRKQGTAID